MARRPLVGVYEGMEENGGQVLTGRFGMTFAGSLYARWLMS